MKTTHFYKYATWLLLVLNVLLIAFFLLTKPGPPQRPNKRGFREKAVEILKLSSDQEAVFVASAKKHNEAMNKLGEEENSLLKRYFEPLLDSTQTVDADRLMKEVLEIEKAKIEGTFQHFSEVKNMMNPSQCAEFELFMRRALRHLLLDGQNNAQPPQH